MTWHTVLWMTKHGWDGCSATTSSPKPFHFLNALNSVHTWQDTSTPWNWSSWQEHIGFDTHETVPHTVRDGCMGRHWQVLMATPWHSLPHHPSIKPSLFHSLLKQWACHAELLGFFFGVNKCLNVFSCNHGGLFQRCSFFLWYPNRTEFAYLQYPSDNVARGFWGTCSRNCTLSLWTVACVVSR